LSLLNLQNLENALKISAQINIVNAKQPKDAKKNLKNVLLNVDKKLPKLAGLYALEFQELQQMFASVLLIKNALQMYLNLIELALT